jgi:hypothetical protein
MTAFELKTINQTILPSARVFDSPKTRANQFAPAIRELKLFLAREPARPTNARAYLNFDAAIRLPQFLDFLSENLLAPNSKTRAPARWKPLISRRQRTCLFNGGRVFSFGRPFAGVARPIDLRAKRFQRMRYLGCW